MPPLSYVLFGYLVLISFAGFVSMAADKYKARTGRWRISEASLLAIALLGGSPGSLLGMLCFRHKTRHVKFVVGVPLILTLQVALAIYLLK